MTHPGMPKPVASTVGRALPEPPGEAVGTKHLRQGRIIDAISHVLRDEGHHMKARDVHARVETLRGEPVPWSSVKATLAGNLTSPTPRFVRLARGRYGVSFSAQMSVSRPATTETPGSPRRQA